MIKNKNILFIGFGSSNWIGGLYYVKNIVYTLITENRLNNSRVYIITTKENLNIFKSLCKYKNITILIYKNNFFNRLIIKATRLLFKKTLDVNLLLKIKKYNVNYIYPIINNYPYIGNFENVFWIPDFQHIHLPEMFTQIEIKSRNKVNDYIAKNHKYLVLSSNDAYRDYKMLYPQFDNGIIVQHFISDIEDEIDKINNENNKNVLEKHFIHYKYFIVCNQFWKHKNHITVFKAINYLVNEKHIDIKVICTGNTKDYRNLNYFNELKEYITNNKLNNNIKILGLIPRLEQLILIKNSIAVIQPSLFEGWSTVVEDAKALNKKIILSNLNVNYEQKNNKCIIFDKDNYMQLSQILASTILNN